MNVVRSNAIDGLMRSAGAAPMVMKAATLLWHCGLCAPTALENRAIWCESDPAEQDNYVGWAREAATFKGETRKPYKLTFACRRDLNLLACNGISFRAFTQQHCNYDHSTMRDALSKWAEAKDLDGLFAINGSQSEVLIVRPCDVLNIHQHAVI